MSAAAPEQQAVRGADVTTGGVEWKKVEDRVLEALAPYAAMHANEVCVVEPGAHETFRVEMTGIRYPDGIGSGRAIVTGYRYLGKNYLKLEVKHNRCFRGHETSPRGELFLNNYLFCRAFVEEPSKADLKEAVEGMEAARIALKTREERKRREGKQTPLFLKMEASIRRSPEE